MSFIVRLDHNQEDLGKEKMDDLYPTPHSHWDWDDHVLRVNVTQQLVRWYGPLATAADLSAGDATLVNSADAAKRYIGDYAPGYQYSGPIEETINDIPHVSLFICTETIEHLNDPQAVLKQIREKTNRLVLSTTLDAWDDDNPEHLWAWSKAGVEHLLNKAGFEVDVYQEIRFKHYMYDYQIWGAS